VLEAVGTSLDHVVDSTNFFAEASFASVYPAFEEVRKDVFKGRLPASTSIGVARLLLPDCHVEVKLIVALPSAE
jgi:enamine deaminase RidA (YjgF/YER057c/UK114 family)